MTPERAPRLSEEHQMPSVETSDTESYDTFVSLPRSNCPHESQTLSSNRTRIVRRLKLAGVSLEETRHMTDEEIQRKIQFALTAQDENDPSRIRGNLDWKSLELLRALWPPENTEQT